ncbi:MAG: hypothetical protein RLQ12_22675 [Cyclobacteriaceae bacterium]
MGAVVYGAYGGEGVFFATDYGEPTVEVVGDGAGANLAEAVDFGGVIYFNDDVVVGAHLSLVFY